MAEKDPKTPVTDSDAGSSPIPDVFLAIANSSVDDSAPLPEAPVTSTAVFECPDVYFGGDQDQGSEHLDSTLDEDSSFSSDSYESSDDVECDNVPTTEGAVSLEAREEQKGPFCEDVPTAKGAVGLAAHGEKKEHVMLSSNTLQVPPLSWNSPAFDNAVQKPKNASKSSTIQGKPSLPGEGAALQSGASSSSLGGAAMATEPYCMWYDEVPPNMDVRRKFDKILEVTGVLCASDKIEANRRRRSHFQSPQGSSSAPHSPQSSPISSPVPFHRTMPGSGASRSWVGSGSMNQLAVPRERPSNQQIMQSVTKIMDITGTIPRDKTAEITMRRGSAVSPLGFRRDSAASQLKFWRHSEGLGGGAGGAAKGKIGAGGESKGKDAAGGTSKGKEGKWGVARGKKGVCKGKIESGGVSKLKEKVSALVGKNGKEKGKAVSAAKQGTMEGVPKPKGGEDGAQGVPKPKGGEVEVGCELKAKKGEVVSKPEGGDGGAEGTMPEVKVGGVFEPKDEEDAGGDVSEPIVGQQGVLGVCKPKKGVAMGVSDPADGKERAEAVLMAQQEMLNPYEKEFVGVSDDPISIYDDVFAWADHCLKSAAGRSWYLVEKLLEFQEYQRCIEQGQGRRGQDKDAKGTAGLGVSGGKEAEKRCGRRGRGNEDSLGEAAGGPETGKQHSERAEEDGRDPELFSETVQDLDSPECVRDNDAEQLPALKADGNKKPPPTPGAK